VRRARAGDVSAPVPEERAPRRAALRVRSPPGAGGRLHRPSRRAARRHHRRAAAGAGAPGPPPQGAQPMTEHLELTDKLNRMSVTKHFDAYEDIDWDAPENAIDASDPRWELGADDPIGGSDWYRSLPQETRARFGLHRSAAAMKVGWQFESVLKRGL